MNELILSKMREGDWGAVVRLMREEREGEATGVPREADLVKASARWPARRKPRKSVHCRDRSGWPRGDVVWRENQLGKG